MHPLELVWSWQPLKPLMTLGLVHAGKLCNYNTHVTKSPHLI
jgi:hypothetical protein